MSYSNNRTNVHKKNEGLNLLKVLLGRGGFVNVTDGAVVRPGGAVGAVPRVVAVDPRQLAGEGGEEVEQGPGDDDVVVEAHVEGNEDDCKAHTCRTFTKAAKTELASVPGALSAGFQWGFENNKPPVLFGRPWTFENPTGES